MMSIPQKFEYTRSYLTMDGIPFIVRPATSEDRDTIVHNIQVVCHEKVYLHTDTFMLTHEWQQTLKQSVDNAHGNLLLVVQVKRQIVGHLRLFAEWYGQRGRHVGDIGIVLLADWRERSIGTMMMRYTIEWAKQAHFEKLTAIVIATNERALNLFRKFEFVQEGYRPRQLRINQKYEDEILLGRSL